jgi:hypothetical protein
VTGELEGFEAYSGREEEEREGKRRWEWVE